LYLGEPPREELPAKVKAKQDEIFRSVKEGSFRVLIAGAAHTSFSDEPFGAPGNGAAKARVLTVVRAYLVEFFRRQLLGRRTELFDGPSTAYPEARWRGFRNRRTEALTFPGQKKRREAGSRGEVKSAARGRRRKWPGSSRDRS